MLSSDLQPYEISWSCADPIMIGCFGNYTIPLMKAQGLKVIF